jgi:hypothetical protein
MKDALFQTDSVPKTVLQPMELLALAVVTCIAGMIVGMARLLFLLGTRGPAHALSSLGRSSRSLFGPDGPPEELCRRLIQKQPTLRSGSHGGLSFSGSGCPGRLDFISDRTEIRFDLDGRVRENLEVSTPTIMTRLAEDDPEAFQVRGSNTLYRRIFSNPEIGRMLSAWGVVFEWTLGPSGFCLVIRDLPQNEEELWRWLNGAFALLQAVPGLERDAAITVEAKLDLSRSICQVCGEGMTQGQVVYCWRCATPHHEECWVYARECSTFGCKESRFARNARK